MTYIPDNLTDLANFPNVDATRIYNDLLALDNLLSGNLTADNFSPDAQLSSSILLENQVEEIFTFNLPLQGASVVALPFASVNMSASQVYTPLDVYYSWQASGGTPAANNFFQLLWGTMASGGFTTLQALTASNVAWYATSAGASTATLSYSGNVSGVGLILAKITQATTPPSAGYLSISLRCVRGLI